MDNCGNWAVRAWRLSCMKQDQTHTHGFINLELIHISVMRFCRGWILLDMILSEAASSAGRFHSRTTGGNASSLLYSQVLKSTNHLHALYWIYTCVCVLPWTAHTAGPPSLDSSGLRSCSVSPWTSHWNTQIDFNSRLKVWRERRVWVLQISFSFPECVEMTLLQFDKKFSLSFKYHYISLCDVMCISSRSTPGCCCPRRVSGGFTKEKRLLQISPPASNSKAACLSLFLASGNSKILSAGVSDSVL